MGFGVELTDELLREGKFALAIERDRFWIRRRVDSIQLQSPHTNNRHVTLDIDLERVRRHVQQTLLCTPKAVFVPVMVLPKQLLLDFDARNSDNKSLSVATRDTDAKFATLMMLASLSERGVPRAKLSQCIIDAIFSAASQPRALNVTAETPLEALDNESLKILADDEREAANQTWSELLRGYPEFFRLLQKYASNFMAMVPVDPSQGIEIVKFRYVETTRPTPGSTDLFGRLGFSWIGAVDMPHIGSSSREHVRVQAPQGLQIRSCNLVRKGSDPNYTFRPEETQDRYEYRHTLQQAIVYTKDVARSPNHELAVAMQPERRGFLRQSMWLCLVSFLVLLGGALAEFFGRRLSGAGHEVSKEGEVVLLLLIPTLLLALMARDGEAEIVSTLLFVPRIFIGLTAGANVCAGTALTLNASGGWLATSWLIASAFGLVGATLLFAISRISHIYARETLEGADSTAFPYIWRV